MKKQIPTAITRYSVLVTVLLASLFLAGLAMPRAIGQRPSNEFLKTEASKAAIAQESVKADVTLPNDLALLASAPQVCTFNGTLGTAPMGGTTGTLAARLFRGGVVTTCASATYPGDILGTFIYNAHTITNSTASPLCTMVTLHYVSGGTAVVNFQVAAFQSPFAPADIMNAAQYLGDPGANSGDPPLDISFSVNVPAGATIALIVFNTIASPAGTGAVYEINLNQDAFCPPAPNITAAGMTITAEGCAPPNGVVDPGEEVIVDLKLMNRGAISTTNLVATLLPGGGVTNPSAPQNYGVVAPGGMAARSFSFTADNALACGEVITATLQLVDSGNPLPNVPFNFTTGVLVALFSENFDGIAPPALPAGWTTDQGTNAGGFPNWVTSNSGTPAPVADSAPNSAYTVDPPGRLDNRLYTPSFIYTGAAHMTCRMNYDLEQLSGTVAYDAGVLEISINGGAYQDIVTAGGSFVAGGYNNTGIASSHGNPLLPSRPNWSGVSGGFQTTTVSLPAAGAGQPVKLRWRMGSDSSVSRAGWRVDSVVVTGDYVCCVSAPTVTSAVSLKTHGGAGDFGIDMPLSGPTGVECRSGGGTNEFAIKVTFSGNVTVMGSPQAEVISGMGIVGSGGVSNGGMVTVMGNMVTIPLTHVADQQTINVRLNGVNSASDAPAVDVTIPMSRLLGDTNGNRAVNASDVSQTRGRIGQPVTSVDFRSDVNANGAINAADVSFVKANSGHAVP